MEVPTNGTTGISAGRLASTPSPQVYMSPLATDGLLSMR